MYHNSFRITLLVTAIAIMLSACGASTPIPVPATATEAIPTATEIAPTNTPQPTPTTSATKVPVSPLVGEWQRVNSCASFVQAFKEAELIDLAPEWLVGGGYFTSLDQINNTDLCKGATEVVHSHFFTANGGFGSHDEMGRQVDDGSYRVVDDRTISFPSSDVTVHFSIEGDTLTFEVVVPDPCEGTCRDNTAWALSAFYPGPFQRMP